MTFLMSPNTKGVHNITSAENDKVFREAIEVILRNGLDELPDALSIIINEAMRVERSRTFQTRASEKNDSALPQCDLEPKKSPRTFGQSSRQVKYG